MKKLLIINLSLLILLSLIPTITITKYELRKTEPLKLTSRVKTMSIKNYELKVDSDLRVLSRLSKEDYDKMLKGTGLENLGQAFVDAEQTYKVNGLYLAGLCALESAYGKSNFAIKRNNLTGYGANTSNPGNAKYFNSKEECIMFTAKLLSEKYLIKGAVYFNGYSAKAVDKRYCQDPKHADKIITIINKLKGELK